jgi:actinin alpha
MKKKYNQVTEELNQRLTDLEKENKKQHEHEKILTELLNLCKDYIIFVEKSLKDIAQDSEGTEEEKLEHVEKYSTEALQTSAKKLEGIKKASTLIEEAEISEKAEYSYQEMESLGDQIKNSSKKRINALQEQVFQKKIGSVTKEQIKEFNDTFKHFDKTNRNKLNKAEFKGACSSVGEDIPDNVLESTFKVYDKDEDGFISFEEFLEFMSGIVKEGTGFEDVIESFRAITGGKDVITKVQLEGNLDKVEAEYLMKKMPQVDGGYDFVAYAKKTFGK